ncbi:fructosamine kinase family protein [Isoptericola jiangsuensis]|uniref:fructosamine kinase family protein n=1 Tax=Isoptericola jiangsuensis TaxID=548579 RepID=UPI003AAA27E8
MGTFRKARADAPAGFFETEAAGLRWLDVVGGPRVARVLGTGPTHLDLERIGSAAPTRAAARDLGRRLATMHDAGAPAFGVLAPGARRGFFGPLDDPLVLVDGAFDDWPTFYAQARLRPVVEQGRDRGVLDRDDAAAVDAVCARLGALAGPAEPPSRLHGDLWSGNVMWTRAAAPDAGGSAGDDGGDEPDGVAAVLVDPAAHGGHREADLAMLALFGAPHLEVILAAYDETHPLAPGWRDRVDLHQLYPLAVHAVLFGGGYVDQVRRLLESLAHR